MKKLGSFVKRIARPFRERFLVTKKVHVQSLQSSNPVLVGFPFTCLVIVLAKVLFLAISYTKCSCNRGICTDRLSVLVRLIFAES